MEMVSTITTLISNVVTFAGGLLLLFGAVTLGTNLKDHAVRLRLHQAIESGTGRCERHCAAAAYL